MNNTAERAVAGQRSHPLLPDGHKTNALLRDRMWPGLVCQQDLPEELVWPVAWPKRAVGLFIYHGAQPPVQISADATAWQAFCYDYMFQRHFNLI